MKIFFNLLIVNFSLLIITCFAQQPGWQVIPSGTTSSLQSIHFADYDTGYVVGEEGTILKSIDGGVTWQSIQSPVTNDLNDLFVFDGHTVVAVGDSGTMVFSSDGGLTWEGGSFIEDDIFSVSFSDGKGVCGASSQTILYCTYDGTSMVCATAQTGFFGGGFPGASMLSPQIGFVAGTNSIFQPLLGTTTDMGTTWNFISFYLDNNEGDATGVEFTDISTGYVSAVDWMGRGAIAKTTNGGTDWVTTFFTPPLWSIDFPISGASQIGYACGDQGTILKTYDAGSSWQSQLTGTTQNLNKIYFSNLIEGYAVGENGTILRTTTGGEPPTGIEEDIKSGFTFELEQNYPNPFNPATKIEFTISDFGFTTLKVYDVLGNEIQTLVNEEKQAGQYEVEFSAKGGSASGGNAYNLSSGIYFYHLRTGSFIQTKKMVYLK